MKAMITHLAAAIFVVALSASAQAATMNFDDIPTVDGINPTITSGGFTNAPFTFGANMQVVNFDPASPFAGAGPAHSGSNAIWNGLSDPVSGLAGAVSIMKTDSSLFSFSDIWIRTAGGDLAVTLTGFLNGSAVTGQTTGITAGNGWQDLVANFTGIDQVVFSITPDFGTDLILLDDMTYDKPAVAPVPEPSSLLLVAAGLAGLTLWRKRQQLNS